MDAKTLTALRPANDSSNAIAAARDAATHQRALAADRHAVATENRRTAMVDPAATHKDIVAFEAQVAAATLDIERLDLMIPDLKHRHAAALVAEEAAEQQQAIDEAREHYDRLVGHLRTELGAYPAYAAAIVRVCELERETDAALAVLRNAMPHRSADPSLRDMLPRIADFVVLPGLDGPRGEKMLWGRIMEPQRVYPQGYSRADFPYG